LRNVNLLADLASKRVIVVVQVVKEVAESIGFCRVGLSEPSHQPLRIMSNEFRGMWIPASQLIERQRCRPSFCTPFGGQQPAKDPLGQVSVHEQMVSPHKTLGIGEAFKQPVDAARSRGTAPVSAKSGAD
jgi:hypothetical protein